MNVAGVWNLPIVFVILNNQWAISVPRQAQTRCETLAQKAIAAGIEGIQVDGNDIFALLGHEIIVTPNQKLSFAKGITKPIQLLGLACSMSLMIC